MTFIHAAEVTVHGTASAVPLLSLLPVVGGGLLLLHVVRATRVSPATAAAWLRQRNLPQDQRTALAVEAYLRRLRWSRVWSTGLLIAVCAVSLFASAGWISFVSLPFLLSILAAEALAPAPRRGRVRVASLVQRPRSFFAPRLALTASRLAIAVGAGLSAVGALVRESSAAAVHGLVLLTGLLALELSLHKTVSRALPDRQPDLSVDTAMRVASSRAATAAGLLFGMFGLAFALGAAGVSDLLGRSGSIVVGQTLTLTTLAALAVALNLVQPLASWSPREGE
ncbi:MAG: hypothetical protein JWN77_1358 [Frankiales bacterium]|jgi:hypothetical protein|nr:hypothetical protein [Frankiales bacterium]